MPSKIVCGQNNEMISQTSSNEMKQVILSHMTEKFQGET